MKKVAVYLLFPVFLLTVVCVSCSNTDEPTPDPPKNLSVQNLQRAMQLVDNAIGCYFVGNEMIMYRYYNPYSQTRTSEIGSVWMYTSSIEAVNAILHALQSQKSKGINELYDNNYGRYVQLLSKLYDNLEFYKGTFTLISYTQTKEWSVYGVNRGRAKGSAIVEGIENVYDDQEWLVREMIESYRITGNEKYLEQAEYLTDYILDGWDCTLDENKEQHGGITWGPGYVTKHACSNGPIISPLVWLSEIYENSDAEITYRYIGTDYRRNTATARKSEYYSDFAEAVYAWQKKYLLRPDNHVYDDMMGGCVNGNVTYETIYGVKYRRHENLTKREAPPISYNSGTMLSGASDLYRLTGTGQYLSDLESLSQYSFQYFAKYGTARPGFYTFSISGFNNWFNGVLMRGYVDAYNQYAGVAPCIKSFQDNLDYGYENYLYNGLLPTNLLLGWNMDRENNKVEAMFTFAFAAEYAVLARYELEK